MPYVTSWERRGLKRGEELGRLDLVLRLLKRKLGELEQRLTAQIETLSALKLNQLGEARLEFDSPADLEKWLQRKAK
jgi:predicted transposase YdaD